MTKLVTSYMASEKQHMEKQKMEMKKKLKTELETDVETWPNIDILVLEWFARC